ncbi:ste24c [Drosophila busckii]|uniref:CAAX prenyl protease n=2 Tax=Drosophila busckii TaxID=30019 RepID=A0A0M4EA96_DROBS|nr:ste24c [Drosophila busckii]
MVPEELRGIIPPEIFYRARIYELHKMELRMWKYFVDIILTLIELFFGFYPFVWNLAVLTLKPLSGAEIWVSVIFVFYMSIYITVRCLPVLLYDKCILEVRYGTRSSMPTYCYCLLGLLAVVLAQFLLGPLTMLVVLSVELLGWWFFMWYYLAWAVLTILMIFLLPYVCIPCVGVQRRLQPGPLYNEVKVVCDMVGFPMKRVFIIRTRTTQYSNAYFYGSCCLKRIVIFDTLLLNKGLSASELKPFEVGRGLTNIQVAAVVAHELGHWRKGHFYKATFIMKIHLLLTMLIFGVLFHCKQIYEAIGFEPGLCPIVVGFIIVMRIAMIPYLTLANFFILWNLRRFEYSADRFAHMLGYSLSLRSALVKIYADHMSFPVYDTCYARWNHTHPTILQRLEYQERLDQK